MGRPVTAFRILAFLFVFFRIVYAQDPVVTSLSPSSVTAGTTFTLTVIGEYFCPAPTRTPPEPGSCVVVFTRDIRFEPTINLTTYYDSDRQLRADVPGALILELGTYEIRVARQYPADRVLSQRALLTVTSTGLPNIVLSATSVVLTTQQGGSTVSQNVTVSSSTGSTFSFTATPSAGATWLSVAPTSGTTPLTISIRGNPTGLNQGNYSATVRVSSAGAANSPQDISVVFNVTPPSPSLVVSPASLSFYAQAGTSVPQSQTVTITSTSTELNYTITTAAAWLSASPTSGNTPSSTIVTVNPSNLAAGTHHGTVTINSPGAGNNPQTVAVTLTLTTGTPNLGVNPSSLFFTVPQGSATQSQTVSVTSTGAPLNFAVTTSRERWMSVSPLSGTTPATLTVTVNPGSESIGLQTGTITISSEVAGNSPQTVTVTFNVTVAAPTLNASPAALNFSATRGGSAPPAQNLFVTSTGGSLGFTVQFATAGGGQWLNVTPLSGTTPTTLTASVDQAGLGNGTYTGTLTLIPRAAESRPLIVSVTMVVGDVPRLAVVPSALNFQYRRGEGLPSPQLVSIFSTLASTPFTARIDGGTWASASPASGQAPGTVMVRIDPGGLGAGTHTAQLVITGQNTNPPSLTVQVTLTFEADRPPQLDVLPREITYSSVRGSPLLVRQFAVLNTGGGTLQFIAEKSGGAWLNLATTQGSATAAVPGFVGYTLNLTGLAAGTYSADIIIRDRNSSQTGTHQVTLVVSPDAQVMLLSQTALEFTALVQETGRPEVPRPAAQVFGVLNIGEGSMPWTVEASTLSGGPTWLRTSPSRGTAVAGSATVETVSVSVDQAGLAAGRYHGRVRVLASGATNSPQTVSVVLNVVTSAQNLPPTLSPSGLVFIGQAGGASPAGQEVSLSGRTGQPYGWTSTAGTEDGSGWLSRTPAGGQVPATGSSPISVQASTSGLGPGVRRGVIRYSFSDGTVRTLSVLLVVIAPGGGGGFETAEVPRLGIPGCRPSSLAAAFTTLDQNFNVSVGERVSLKARVRDNCDDPVITGMVLVRISGETSPLNLSHEGGGIWATTWVPGRASADTRLSLTAIVSQASVFLAGQADLAGSVGAGGGGAGEARPRGVVNPASFQSAGRITPGSWAAIFGDDLASGNAIASAVPFPRELLGSRVTLGGMTLVLYSVSPGQVNALVPWGLRSNAVQQLLVERGATLSLSLDATVTDLIPGIFTQSQTGSGQGAILVAGTGILAAPAGAGARPARRGEFLEIYASGLGPVDNTPADGVPAPANATVRTPLTVTIGGQRATVTFAGLAPGFFGLYQVNVQVPDNAPVSNAVPVVISAGGLDSNTVTIAVQ